RLMTARAYRAETARMLKRRLDVAVVLFLLAVGISVVLEWLFHPERAIVLGLVYGAEIAGLVLGAVGLPLAPALPALRAAGPAAAFSLPPGVDTGLVAGRVERSATAEVCLLAGLVVLLPWGWRAQLVVSLAALASLALATADWPTTEAVAYSILAVMTGG